MREEISDFAPLPALWNNATDLSLYFLSANDVVYTKPCDDPWYAAHSMRRAVYNGSPTSRPLSVYFRDEAVRVLGCGTRYQICSATNNVCTHLTGYLAATSAAQLLWPTKKQMDFFNASSMYILNKASNLFDPVLLLRAKSLAARDSMTAGTQGPLPKNQWQLEVENWFVTAMADLQRAAVEYATGPRDQTMARYKYQPETRQERLLCRSQVSNPLLAFICSHL